MISYLLSGWRVYVPDENGNPLYHGRVYFYDASTSEPSTVYADKEGVTSLGTYVDVDNNGYLPAIWLSASHLYKVVVKRLIQADPETWDTMWEVDDVGNPFLTSEEALGASTLTLNTLSDLKGIGPNDAGRPDYAYVMGWFNPGDTGSPMLFRWVSGHNTVVDDGHWISPIEYGFGSWEQIFSGDLDPRKFGAIPDSDNSCDVSFSNCMSYASEPHTIPTGEPYLHFPKTVHFVKEGTYKMNATFDFTLYTMISAYKSAPVPIVVDDGVYFDKTVTFGKGARINSSSPIAARPIFSNKDSYLKFSWFWIYAGIADSASRVVIIDNYDQTLGGSVTLTNKLVINLLDSVPSSVTLTDCVLIDAHDGSISPALVNLGAYIVSHQNGVPNQLFVKHGNSTIFKLEDSFAKFLTTLFIQEGFYVDTNNFLMQPEGESAKYLSLKINAILDLVSKNGLPSGMKFDQFEVTNKADINQAEIDFLKSWNNESIMLQSGIRRTYLEHTWTFSSYGSHDFGLIPNVSSYSKFNIVIPWFWTISDDYLQDYFYLEGANGFNDKEIICIENCGPKGYGYEPSNLGRNGELDNITNKSGPLYVLGGSESGYTNKIIDVIPPFTRKYYMWSDSAEEWKPVSV